MSAERPPNGYAISLYDSLRYAIPFYAEQIEEFDGKPAHADWVTYCRQRLAESESTLAWMLEHQAHEIAALESARRATLAALNAAQAKQEARTVAETQIPTTDTTLTRYEAGGDGI